MPVHRVPADDLEAQVAALEKNNRIVAVTSAGEGAFVVVVEPRNRGGKETRG